MCVRVLLIQVWMNDSFSKWIIWLQSLLPLDYYVKVSFFKYLLIRFNSIQFGLDSIDSTLHYSHNPWGDEKDGKGIKGVIFCSLWGSRFRQVLSLEDSAFIPQPGSIIRFIFMGILHFFDDTSNKYRIILSYLMRSEGKLKKKKNENSISAKFDDRTELKNKQRGSTFNFKRVL